MFQFRLLYIFILLAVNIGLLKIELLDYQIGSYLLLQTQL